MGDVSCEPEERLCWRKEMTLSLTGQVGRTGAEGGTVFQAEGRAWQGCCLLGAAHIGGHSAGVKSAGRGGWRGGQDPELAGLVTTLWT